MLHVQKAAYTTPPWLPSFLGKIKLNGDGMGNFTSFLCPDIFIAVIMTSHWPLDGLACLSQLLVNSQQQQLNNRVHSKFNFQVPHSNVKTTFLATDQKWSWSCIHISYKNWEISRQKLQIFHLKKSKISWIGWIFCLFWEYKIRRTAFIIDTFWLINFLKQFILNNGVQFLSASSFRCLKIDVKTS